MTKPLLCLDMDGVLHSYTSGWKGADQLPDPPVPGAFEFLAEALKHFRVAIYSSRSGQPGGIAAMQHWLMTWDPKGGTDWKTAVEWPTSKPAAFLTLDDRAITFAGLWPSIEDLKAFKPWNKGGTFSRRASLEILRENSDGTVRLYGRPATREEVRAYIDEAIEKLIEARVWVT